MQIVPMTDPALTAPAKLVNIQTEDVRPTILQMQEILASHADGVGLAANQVGIAKKIIVFRDSPYYAINANIVKIKDKTIVTSTEGCLSNPGQTWDVDRYSAIQVQYFDLSGFKICRVYKGFQAIVWQHEIDHTNGISIWD